MFHYYLLLVLLLIILIKSSNNILIEGNTSDINKEVLIRIYNKLPSDVKVSIENYQDEQDDQSDQDADIRSINNLIKIENDNTDRYINEKKEIRKARAIILNDDLKRIRESNFKDMKSFEIMSKKGICTNEPDTLKNHSCKLDEPIKEKQIIDFRYLNQAPRELNYSENYNLLPMCVEKYKTTIDQLISESIEPDPKIYNATLDPSISNPKKFFKNKYSRGQYPGYTTNNYLDRTRYIESDEPLPVNPDFFMKNGGSYA